MSTVQMEPTLRTVSPSRKSLLPLAASQWLTARLNNTVFTPVNSLTYFSHFFLSPRNFQTIKKKKSAGAISFQIHSLKLDVTRQSGAVHQKPEQLCFLLHGRQMPPSQLCCTRKLATFKKHNHLRMCNKSREMGKWPYCQLAKDKWRALICEFTGFLHTEVGL